jgi:hypothetical protein
VEKFVNAAADRIYMLVEGQGIRGTSALSAP